MPLIRDDPG